MSKNLACPEWFRWGLGIKTWKQYDEQGPVQAKDDGSKHISKPIEPELSRWPWTAALFGCLGGAS
jgi:hypothetical protein